MRFNTRSVTVAAIFSLSATACRRPALAPPPPSETIALEDAGGTSIVSVARTPAHGCPALVPHTALGHGTTHGSTVSGNEVWTLEGSPHRVPNGIHLLAGASVTVSPCAVILVGAGRDFVVQDDAALLALGEASKPIRFDSAREAPAPGDWIGLEIRAHARPATRLAWVTVAHAGAEDGNANEPDAAVRTWLETGLDLDHVTVRESSQWGVALLGRGGFHPRSGTLTVTASQGPGAIFFADTDQVRTLPAGAYTGNRVNDIFLSTWSREVRTSGTWRNPGADVRYVVRRAGRVIVEGPANPQLVIAPGARVAFEDDAEMVVGWDQPGALLARGEASQRVIFTTARTPPEPASWVGLFFGPHLDVARSGLDHALIESAGAPADAPFVVCPSASSTTTMDTAMLFLQGLDAPRLVTHTTFHAGPPRGFAILRSGDFPSPVADLCAPDLGNDLVTAGVRCAQSQPRIRGECPQIPACP